MRTKPSLNASFAPHAAMFAGAMIAWVSMTLVRPTSLDFVSVLGRFQTVAFSMTFWAVFQAYSRGLEMWGGGTIELLPALRPRLQNLAILLMLSVLVAALLLVKGWFSMSAAVTAFVLLLLICEIGWGNAWMWITGTGRDDA